MITACFKQSDNETTNIHTDVFKYLFNRLNLKNQILIK